MTKKTRTDQLIIDPTVDCVFKAILGDAHHKDLLIHFLNSVLELPDDQRVTDIHIQNPFIPKISLWSKGPVVDIRATDQLGRVFQVEIQVRAHLSMVERILFNWAGLYYKELPEGVDYDQLKQVVGIWLMVDDLLADVDEDHLLLELYCRQAGRRMSEHLDLHVFQLSKLKKGTKLNDRDRWLRFFAEGATLDPNNLPDWMQTREMKKVMKIMSTFTQSQRRRAIYESRLDFQRAQNMVQHELDLALEQAKQADLALEQARLTTSKALERERVAKQRERTAKQRARTAAEALELERAERERERAATARLPEDYQRILALAKQNGLDCQP